MEPVEPRTGSRMSDGPSKAAQGPFARALGKMEAAGARIVSARLSEEWEGLDSLSAFDTEQATSISRARPPCQQSAR